jgi:hypothetical protein
MMVAHHFEKLHPGLAGCLLHPHRKISTIDKAHACMMGSHETTKTTKTIKIFFQQNIPNFVYFFSGTVFSMDGRVFKRFQIENESLLIMKDSCRLTSSVS